MAYEKINAEIIPEGFEIHPNFQNLEPEMKVAVMAGIKGDKGDKGDAGTNGTNGAAATITVGSTTTGEAGTNASVTNSGTSSAAVFNFTIPQGAKGDTGETGEQGETGETGNGIESASIDEDGYLTLSFTDGNDWTSDISLIGEQGEQGETGQTGATGNGISSISKTGTSGLVDTYTVTFTNGNSTTFTVTNGRDGSGFDVVITEESNELTCNATMLDILNAVWQGKTLNAVFNGSSEQISLAYYIYPDENYGYVDFYGISQFGYVIGIKYSVADGLEYKQTPYSIYNVIADRAYSDASGNSITTTYATKSELPANISELNNDAGYITATDILNGDWLGYGTEADTEPVVGLGLVGYMVLGDEGSTSPIIGTGKVGQMKII